MTARSSTRKGAARSLEEKTQRTAYTTRSNLHSETPSISIHSALPRTVAYSQLKPAHVLSIQSAARVAHDSDDTTELVKEGSAAEGPDGER